MFIKTQRPILNQVFRSHLRSMEKRICARHDLEASISFSHFNGDKTFNARMVNCSAGGMYLESNALFKEGTNILLKMKSCCFDNANPEILEVVRSISLAEVKWFKAIKDKDDLRFGIGVKFY